MKLSAIKRVCMDAKKFRIYVDRGCNQWIGTPNAAYPAEGITFTEGNIDEIFDLTEKQSGKVDVMCQMMEESGLLPEVYTVGVDVERMRPGLAFRYLDEMLLPLAYLGKVYIVQEKLIRAAASNGREYLGYFMAQNAKGDPLVFISDGLIAAGIVRPVPEGIAKEACAWLAEYGALTPGGSPLVEFEKDEDGECDGQMRLDDLQDELEREIENINSDGDDSPSDDLPDEPQD